MESDQGQENERQNKWDFSAADAFFEDEIHNCRLREPVLEPKLSDRTHQTFKVWNTK